MPKILPTDRLEDLVPGPILVFDGDVDTAKGRLGIYLGETSEHYMPTTGLILSQYILASGEKNESGKLETWIHLRDNVVYGLKTSIPRMPLEIGGELMLREYDKEKKQLGVNYGIRIPLVLVDRVLNREGKVLWENSYNRKKSPSPGSSMTVIA